MADSRDYRNKFYLLSAVMLVLLLGVLVLLNLTSERTAKHKVDMTADGIYTTSEATKDIFGEIEDEVRITYYCSKELPDRLANLKRDTVDRFEEFRSYSRDEEGEPRIVFEVVDPEQRAADIATEKTDEYMAIYTAAKKDGDDSADLEKLDDKEPDQPFNMAQMFGGAPQPTKADIRKEREKRAGDQARKANVSQDKAYRDILFAEYEEAFLTELAQKGIQPFVFQDRLGNSVKQVKIYSSIKISYLEKEDEIIRLHQSLENLEYELAFRILKITLDEKPVVAFFDSRKPAAPPFNPMQPTAPPPGNYRSITGFLRELADVREIGLKEDDDIDSLAVSIKRERLRKQKEREGEVSTEVSDEEAAVTDAEIPGLVRCLVVAQPDQLEKRQVYEISRAVSLGVRTIFLTSPFSIDVGQGAIEQGLPIHLLRSELDELFKLWGVEFGSQMLASNSQGILIVPQQLRGMRLQVERPVPVSALVGADQEGITKESILTSSVQGLVFPATSGIELNETTLKQYGLEPQKLVWTGEETWAVSVDPVGQQTNPFQRGPTGPSLVGQQEDLVAPKDPEKFQDWTDERVLAVQLTGKFPFLFQGETVPAWEPPPKEDEAGGPPNPHAGIPGMPGGLPPGFPGSGNVLPDPQDPVTEDQPIGAENPPAGGDASTAAAPPEGSDGAPAAGDATEKATAPEGAIGPPRPADTKETGAADATDATASDAAAPDASAEPAIPAEPAVPAEVDVADGRVVLLASGDMLRDDYLRLANTYPQYYQNAELFRTMVQTFTLHDKLTQIRKKNVVTREFSENSESWAVWIILLNLALVPLVVAIIGALRFLIRRSLSVSYERRFIQQQARQEAASA